jgi:hypothetical protein
MTAIVLSNQNIKTVKRALREWFPEIISSHLTEAFAAALGFRNQAALRASLQGIDKSFPNVLLINEHLFVTRLKELGNNFTWDDKHDLFYALPEIPYGEVLLKTETSTSGDVQYKSTRNLAWRNMMVAAINAGVKRKLFSVLPGDNRWPGFSPENSSTGDGQESIYRFTFGTDIPAIASVHDIGSDELSFHVALWPTEDAERWIRAANSGKLAGKAFASGWLERQNGAYLQSSTDELYCQKAITKLVANTVTQPLCFGDRGKVIF